MSLRTDKVASEVQAICAAGISRFGVSPNSLVTVTRTTVSPDLRSARVYISFLGNKPTKLDRFLLELRDFLQDQVASQLVSKFTPKLQLRVDDSLAVSADINQKLKQL